MGKIVSICMIKGGVAKTSTVAALASAAAYSGKKTLAIDMDAQGNLSFALGANTRSPGSQDLLEGKATAADCIQHTRAGIDVIAAGQGLTLLSTGKGSAKRLQRALEPVRGMYDFIFTDTPPNGELLFNALQAADAAVFPIHADVYNLQALYQIMDIVRHLQKSNPALTAAGFIVTRSGRSNISKTMRTRIDQTAAAAGVPYLGSIRTGAAVEEAAALRTPLFEYAPKSNPARDYLAIFEQLCQ